MALSQIRLSKFLTIPGISGGSGLICQDHLLHVISDDSFVLYTFSLSDHSLRATPLNPQGKILEHLVKSDKPDFESIAQRGERLHIFGSGSTAKRCQQVILDALTLEVKSVESVEILYQHMRTEADMQAEDFNIEGVFFHQHNAYFLNRGNGPLQRNGIFRVSNFSNPAAHQIVFIPKPLPALGNLTFDFTDAVLIADKVFFLAGAEATENTYDDGEILGSAIGVMTFPELEIIDLQKITAMHKLEGITLYQQDGSNYTFLLCEDADNGQEETKVFQLCFRLE